MISPRAASQPARITAWSPNAVVGAYVGYANSNSDSRRGAGKVDLNSGKFGVYGTVFDKGFYVNGALQGGYNSYDTRRSVLGQNAISSPEGEEFTGYLGTGYEARFKNFSFGPIASLQVNYVGVDQFTETGSASPLTVTNMDKYSVRSHFGAQANYAVKVLGLALTPHVSAQWQHEFLDTETAIDSRFASGSGGLFTVYSVETGADTALLGAGLDVQITPAVGTYVDYDGEVGASRYEAHSVNGGVRIKF
jgi:outer membrane autotransporter protein